MFALLFLFVLDVVVLFVCLTLLEFGHVDLVLDKLLYLVVCLLYVALCC